MARRYHEIKGLAEFTAKTIVSDEREWKKFLHTAGHMYKYPFREQMLIYAQRPDATACASLELWNEKMNCWVNKGAQLNQGRFSDLHSTADWQVGETYMLDGFLSTSVRYKDAAIFRTREIAHGKDGLMLTVRVPAGTTSLFVGENTSYTTYQGELILAHGLKYKVIERTESGMLLEVIPDGRS